MSSIRDSTTSGPFAIQISAKSPSKKRLWKGTADAEEWLHSQIETPITAEKLEEGTVELARGRDGGAAYVIQGKLASSVKPEQIIWLWPDRLPLGKMSLLSGKPDCGKSTVTLDIVARVTTGADWPDASKNEIGPRDVLMAVAEDDLSDTVIPRLMAAGADLNRIHFVERVVETEFDEKEGRKSGSRTLQLAKDIQKIKAMIDANPQVALVIVDTLTSYFGDVNANADQEIRPVMDALAKAFRDCKACFLGIVHHNKKADVDALQKILGASSVAGSVRAIFTCSRDPENEDECYFALVKNNLTRNRTGMKYKFAEKTLNGITAPCIDWTGTTDHDANSVMAIEKEARSQKNTGVDKARLFIPMALEKGPIAARDLYQKAEAEGISADQLKRAKNGLNVTVMKRKNGWYWSMPQKDQTIQYEDLGKSVNGLAEL